VPGEGDENTYCYTCGSVLIERYGFQLIRNRVDAGNCPECGAKIDGVGLSPPLRSREVLRQHDNS